MKKFFFISILIILITFSFASAITSQELKEELQTALDKLYEKGVISYQYTAFTPSSSEEQNFIIVIGEGLDYSQRFSGKQIAYGYVLGNSTIQVGGANVWYANNNQNYWISDLQYYSMQTGVNQISGSNRFGLATIDYVYSTLPVNASGVVIDAYGEYGGQYINQSFLFNPWNYWRVPDINGNTIYTIKYGYSIQEWLLGQFEDLGGFIGFEIQFRDFDNSNDLVALYRGYISGDSFVPIVDTDLYVNHENNLKVTSRLVYYNHIYKLVIRCYDNVNLEDASEQYVYYYRFLPINAEISGVVGESGEIIYSGDGDFDSQNSTNAIITYITDTSSANNYLDELSQSGEIANRLNYRVLPNPSYQLLFAMTKSITDTLYGSGDVIIPIDFDHNGYVYNLNSGDFKVPMNRLTQFIIYAVNFGFIYLLYKQGAELIHTIQEGDLYVLELEDANEYFYM